MSCRLGVSWRRSDRRRLSGGLPFDRCAAASAAARELEQAGNEADASLLTIKQQVMSDQVRLVREALESRRSDS